MTTSAYTAHRNGITKAVPTAIPFRVEVKKKILTARDNGCKYNRDAFKTTKVKFY